MPFPTVYMLTCPRRKASAVATLERWHETDWGTGPHCILDGDPEVAGEEWGTPGRGARLAAVFAGMLAQALDDGGADDDWMLFLEDDLAFHPRIGMLVETWPALEDPRCGLASLFNPMLRATERWGEMPRAFAALPESFLGAQALLLRRWAAERAVQSWNTVSGLQSQRLAQPLGPDRPTL